jgi:peptidoglycan-associated lipoprotein
MKKRIFICSVMMFLLLALMATGCAKKAAKQAEEVTPPQKAAAGTGQEMKPAEAAPSEAAAQSAAASSAGFDKKVYFDFDKFDLKPEALETLNELASFLKGNTGLKVKIEGNCDERGTTEYNLALGERRAKAALDYIVSQGINSARVSTISYGKEKPADPSHNEEAWVKNRRDEFILSK